MEALIFGILLYYMKSNNTQYKNKYKNTYSSNQNEKKNNEQLQNQSNCVLLLLVDLTINPSVQIELLCLHASVPGS